MSDLASDPAAYRAFGLTVRSDLALPELLPAAADAVPDIAVRVVDGLPPVSPALHRLHPTAAAGADTFDFEATGAGRFRVTQGRDIALRLADDADPGTVRATLLGTAIGAALLQRGRVTLHASSIAIGERAVALLGRSGAGKSTLALALQQRGHAVLGDDLCAPDPAGAVSPGVTRLKLWPESLALAAPPTVPLEPVWAGYDKVVLPPARLPHDRAVPLAAIFVLDWSDGAVAVTPLRGSAAVEALMVNSFRGMLVEPMGLAGAYMRQCAALARAVPVLRLTRPRALDRLGAAADAVCAALA